MRPDNKLHIEIFILVFMFTVGSLCILFSFYYISPNNYVLYDMDSNNKKISSREYTIEALKQKKIKYTKYKNKKLRILSNEVDCIPIILETKFKSDNIYISKNKLIKLLESNLIIKNTTNTAIKVLVETYSE
jgi:hypothetical protein